MTKETRNEFRYYTPLIMGFSIMLIALLCPPIGSLPSSSIYAGGCFLVLAGAVIGMDIPAILHEVNELKRIKVEQIKQDNSDNDE